MWQVTLATPSLSTPFYFGGGVRKAGDVFQEFQRRSARALYKTRQGREFPPRVDTDGSKRTQSAQACRRVVLRSRPHAPEYFGADVSRVLPCRRMWHAIGPFGCSASRPEPCGKGLLIALNDSGVLMVHHVFTSILQANSKVGVPG